MKHGSRVAIALLVGAVFAPAARPALAADMQVTISWAGGSNFSFGPSLVTVTVGDTVNWRNMTPESHIVTSDSGLFQSGPIPSGGAFALRFQSAGTFPYHCQIHPTMHGEVVVVAAPNQGAAPQVASPTPSAGGAPQATAPPPQGVTTAQVPPTPTATASPVSTPTAQPSPAPTATPQAPAATRPPAATAATPQSATPATIATSVAGSAPPSPPDQPMPSAGDMPPALPAVLAGLLLLFAGIWLRRLPVFDGRLGAVRLALRAAYEGSSLPGQARASFARGAQQERLGHQMLRLRLLDRKRARYVRLAQALAAAGLPPDGPDREYRRRWVALTRERQQLLREVGGEAVPHESRSGESRTR
jgi:plastocyanin